VAETGEAWQRARRVLEGARLPADRLTHVRPLTGGTYNTVEELALATAVATC
jgi:hypothetical protein